MLTDGGELKLESLRASLTAGGGGGAVAVCYCMLGLFLGSLEGCERSGDLRLRGPYAGDLSGEGLVLHLEACGLAA